MRQSLGVGCCAALVLLAAGCGEAMPELGEVSGVVTLDGEPLEGAFVQFEPQGQNLGISTAVTDSAGRYELTYKGRDTKGAATGSYVVRIRDEGNEKTPDGVPLPGGGVVPPVYNDQSTLTAVVKPGQNTFDWVLKSKP